MEWSSTNALPLKVSKCVAMEFNTKWRGSILNSTGFTNHAYFCNGQRIGWVDKHTDLGVIFDVHMDFSDHIKLIITRANQAKASINKCFYFTEKKIKLKLYSCYVCPILEYNSIIWLPVSFCQINSIESIQHSFTRYQFPIRQLNYIQHLSVLNFMSLEHRRQILDLVFLFKVINNNIKLIHQADLQLLNVNSVRLHTNFKEIFTAGHALDHDYSHHVIAIWNCLAQEIKESTSLLSFKHMLFKFYLKKYYTNNWVCIPFYPSHFTFCI